MIIFPGRLWGRKLIRPPRVLTPVFRVRRVPASRYNLYGQYYQHKYNDYTSTETSKIGQLFQQHQEGKRRKINCTDVITLKGIINRFTFININMTLIITISSCMTSNKKRVPFSKTRVPAKLWEVEAIEVEYTIQ